MQKPTRKNLFRSPKALAVYAFAMLLLPLPYSTLEAGGRSRETQGKNNSTQRPPASNAHRRPQARPTPPPATPPSNNSRNSNRRSPSETQRRVQSPPAVRVTPPSASRSTTQARSTPPARSTTQVTRPRAPQRTQPIVRSTPQVRTRTSPTIRQHRRINNASSDNRNSPSRATVSRPQTPRNSNVTASRQQNRTTPRTTSTVKRSTQTQTRIGPQRPRSDTTQSRRPAIGTVSSRTRSHIIDTNNTTTTRNTRITSVIRNQRGNSTEGRQEHSERPRRQQIVEKSYQQNRDVARNIYVDKRRDTESAVSQRRERERQRAIHRIEGKEHHHEKVHPKMQIRQELQDRAKYANRDQRPRNDRHGNYTTRHRHVDKHQHRHGSGCGHHFYKGRWHDYPRQHRHYDGCGHRHHSGSWISFSIGHVHGIGCGHFYDRGTWLSYSGSRHRHHIGCGHFYYDGFWHNTSRYHIHGSGCGHYYYDGRWNNFPRTHVHSENCEHVYDGSRWLIVSEDAHVHSANCGHYQFSGRWHAYPRSYYTMNREDSLYFFVDLGDYRNRNLPEWAYERYLDQGSPIDVFRSSKSLAKAYAAFAKGSYYDSLLQFKRASQMEPQNALIHLAKAQAKIAVKDYRSAFDDIARGMELFPEWADAYVNLSEIYSRTEDLERHTLQLEQWVERYPRDFKAHFVLGYFYYFHQEYDAAKTELLYALSWKEDLEPAQLLMNKILEFEAESEVLTLEEEATPEEEAEITTE